MSNYITRTCPVCSKEYQADTGRLKHGRQTTCSRKCSYELRAQKLTTPTETYECMFCGAAITRRPTEIKGKTFCSAECHDAWRIAQHREVNSNDPHEVKALRELRCIVCDKPFKAKNNNAKQCSRKCFEIAHKARMAGENNPSYIDGRSATDTYDAGAEWHRTRRKVYKRDKYCCQVCGVKCVSRRDMTPKNSVRLIQCHHKDPYKRSKNNDLSNLVTLCIRCHRKVHNGKAHV